MPSRRQSSPDELEAVAAAYLLPDGGARQQVVREHLEEVQRARIVAAMVVVASELGVGGATIARVVARSGVSRRTFYEQFADREECFLAAFEQALGRIGTVVVPAYEESGRWHMRMRAGLTALLQFLCSEPGLGRLVIVETLGAGPAVLERRRQVLAQIVAVVDEGREDTRGDGPSPLTAEGLVGGVLSLIYARLIDEPAPLIELLNPLVSMIVLPYLGPAAARRELERPVPALHGNGGGNVESDPLRDLEMRITYRTIRVLLAIDASGRQGSHPSNRQVADAAGVRDQGQVSKLLARLENLGLIEKAGDDQAKGEPNKWALTNRGAEVCDIVSMHPNA